MNPALAGLARAKARSRAAWAATNDARESPRSALANLVRSLESCRSLYGGEQISILGVACKSIDLPATPTRMARLRLGLCTHRHVNSVPRYSLAGSYKTLFN